jgi:DNA gyrase/topoisomerase IV subunit A
MRKILYTLLKKYPNKKEKIKTETIANICAAFTNYLHGAANLGGVCDTMAQSFVSANNYPLIEGNSGGFGTRINPTCAANRYTKIA